MKRELAVASVCGPLERFSGEFEACRQALLAMTSALSAQLGWSPARRAR